MELLPFQASISRLPWRPVEPKRFTSCQSLLHSASATHLWVSHRAQQGSWDLGTLEISCVNYHKQVCVTAKCTHSLFTTSLLKLKMKRFYFRFTLWGARIWPLQWGFHLNPPRLLVWGEFGWWCVCGGNTHGNKRVCVGGDGECQTEEVEREKEDFKLPNSTCSW